MSLYVRVLEDLEERRIKNEGEGFNCIPSPYPRFSDDFVGVEKGFYYVVTAMAKGAKTQFASRTFIYEPLKQAFLNSDKLKLKIFYYPLEESPQAVFLRYISYLLETESGGEIRISPKELKSVKGGKPVSKDIIDLLQSEVYKKQLSFFEA